MTPEEFMSSINKTAASDQIQAAIATVAQSVATYYRATVEADIDPGIAVELACEIIRCMMGDHKPIDLADR